MNHAHQRIKEIMQKELSSSAHSMDHVMRVYDLCMLIADGEKDVDLDVLQAAVLLHDIARVKENSDTTGNTDHAVLGSVMAEKILKELEFPPEKIEKVKHSIISPVFKSASAGAEMVALFVAMK